MDLNTIILVVEAIVIAGLSTYVWVGAQDADDISTLHWAALFVLVLFFVGFVVTLTFNPLVLE